MTIYYFRKKLEDNNHYFGTGEDELFTTEQALIRSAENFMERKLKVKEFNLICSKEVPDFDFYAVQGWCDGFGNDTYTKACFRTFKEAQSYIKKSKHTNYKIVGQYWNSEYRNYWE